MKSLLLGLVVFASAGAYASTPASKFEVKLMCNTIEFALEDSSVDFAMDTSGCFRGKFTSKVVSNGIEVKGRVPFRNHYRTYDLTCTLVYDAATKTIVDDPTCE